MAPSPSPWREFEERSPALAAVVVGALATLALVIADAFVRDAAQPPRGDELIYERMADHPFGEHTFPFAYRLGVPLLVHVLPFGHEASFSVIAWLAGGGSAALLYVLLRRYEVRPWIAVALGLALVLAPAMLLVSLRQGRNPDAVAVLAMFAGTLCVVDRRPRALAVVLLLGALVRETTLFLIPFAYAMWARRAVDRDALRAVVLAAAPALVAYAVVRWTVPTVGREHVLGYDKGLVAGRREVLDAAADQAWEQTRRVASAFGPLWLCLPFALRGHALRPGRADRARADRGVVPVRAGLGPHPLPRRALRLRARRVGARASPPRRRGRARRLCGHERGLRRPHGPNRGGRGHRPGGAAPLPGEVRGGAAPRHETWTVSLEIVWPPRWYSNGSSSCAAGCGAR